MNAFFEYVRQIVLSEGAATVSNAINSNLALFDYYSDYMGANVAVLYNVGGIDDDSVINDFNPQFVKDGIVSFVGYTELPVKKCFPAKYEVSLSANVDPTKGWGPLVYDYVLSKGWTMSDRHAVSKEAQKVWKYYFENRGSDVERAIVKYCDYEPINKKNDAAIGDFLKYAYRIKNPSSQYDKLLERAEQTYALFEKHGKEMQFIQHLTAGCNSAFTRAYSRMLSSSQ